MRVVVEDTWGDPVVVGGGHYSETVTLEISQQDDACLARLTPKQPKEIRRALKRAEKKAKAARQR